MDVSSFTDRTAQPFHEDLEGTRFVVTGGCGFLGSHLVDRLLSVASSGIVIDNLATGLIANLRNHSTNRNLKIERIDISNYAAVAASIKDVDYVFHFAADPDVRGSGIVPELHFRNNIQGTFNLLEAMRVNNVRKLVFASSSSVYGETGTTPVKESSDLSPVSVYGATKLSCEALIRAFSSTYGLAAVCLRYGNIVGPRLGHGITHDLIMKLRKNPEELEVLGDGMQTRSYLHVEDTIDATLRVLPERGFHAFNVGNMTTITVDQVVSIVIAVLGLTSVKVEHKPTANGVGWSGDVKNIVLDSSKIMQLGWKPRLSSSDAIERTAKSLIMAAA
jgi:UDP-glucose 4-epimerase